MYYILHRDIQFQILFHTGDIGLLFSNIVLEAERVISEATSVGNVRDINGKLIYYIDGAANPKKGVVVIVRDGKIQSMMPSDFKSFNKMQ